MADLVGQTAKRSGDLAAQLAAAQIIGPDAAREAAARAVLEVV